MNETQQQTEENVLEIDLREFIMTFLQGVLRLWPVIALLTALFALAGLFTSSRSYRPMYRAEASFTVETDNQQEGYSFYYDNRTAAQMALTFPYLLDSDLLLDRVKAELEVTYLNGVPSAQVIPNSNLFTLSVTSSSPLDAYNILLAVIDNYPAVSEYVIGKTQLNMITPPEIPSLPYNSASRTRSTVLGAMIGMLLGLCCAVLYALMRDTVRKSTSIEEKLNKPCLGSVPFVTPKRRSKKRSSIRPFAAAMWARPLLRASGAHPYICFG